MPQKLLVIFSFTALLIKSFNLFLPISTYADNSEPKKYNPPKTDSTVQARVSSASRGCAQAMNTNLSLLVPNHLGTTISSHPTFFFVVENIPIYPLRFTLVEPNNPDLVFDKDLTLIQPGLVSVKLPLQTKGLEVGKEYYWTVSIICNKNRPSMNAYARAGIKRVPLSPSLANKLKVNSNHLKKTEIYAQSGIWYDALSSAYQADNISLLYFDNLVEEIGLKNLKYN